jgi:hypothetical protein
VIRICAIPTLPFQDVDTDIDESDSPTPLLLKTKHASMSEIKSVSTSRVVASASLPHLSVKAPKMPSLIDLKKPMNTSETSYNALGLSHMEQHTFISHQSTSSHSQAVRPPYKSAPATMVTPSISLPICMSSNGEVRSAPSPCTVWHDTQVVQILDHHSIHWGVQYMLIWGISSGTWSWNEMTENKLGQLVGKCVDALPKVYKVMTGTTPPDSVLENSRLLGCVILHSFMSILELKNMQG